jgi:hypothetical protein
MGGIVGAAGGGGVGCGVISGEACMAGVALGSGVGCARLDAAPLITQTNATITAAKKYLKVVSSYSSGNPWYGNPWHTVCVRSWFSHSPLVKLRPQWGTHKKQRPMYIGRCSSSDGA